MALALHIYLQFHEINQFTATKLLFFTFNTFKLILQRAILNIFPFFDAMQLFKLTFY